MMRFRWCYFWLLLAAAVVVNCSAGTTVPDNYKPKSFDRGDADNLSEEIIYLHRARQGIFNKLKDLLFSRTAKVRHQNRVLKLWPKLDLKARLIVAQMAREQHVFHTGRKASRLERFGWRVMVAGARDRQLTLTLRKRIVARLYYLDPSAALRQLVGFKPVFNPAMLAEKDLLSRDPVRIDRAVQRLWSAKTRRKNARLVDLLKLRFVQKHLVAQLPRVGPVTRQILLSATFEAFPERFPTALAPIVRAGLKRPDLKLKTRAARAAVYMLKGNGVTVSDLDKIVGDRTLNLQLRRNALRLLFKKGSRSGMSRIKRYLGKEVMPASIGLAVILSSNRKRLRGKALKQRKKQLAELFTGDGSLPELVIVLRKLSGKKHRRTLRGIRGDARHIISALKLMRQFDKMLFKQAGEKGTEYSRTLERAWMHYRRGAALLKKGLRNRGDSAMTQAGLLLSQARKMEPGLIKNLGRTRRKLQRIVKKLEHLSGRLKDATLKDRLKGWRANRHFKSSRLMKQLASR